MQIVTLKNQRQDSGFGIICSPGHWFELMISIICILISFRPQACGPELMLRLFFTLGDEEKVPQKSRDTYFLLNCSFLSLEAGSFGLSRDKIIYMK